jgi:hypothetical protein
VQCQQVVQGVWYLESLLTRVKHLEEMTIRFLVECKNLKKTELNSILNIVKALIGAEAGIQVILIFYGLFTHFSP